MHRTMVLAALENDKHVLTEARMAMDAQEAHEMLDASRLFPHLVTQIVPAPATLQVDQTIQDLIAESYLATAVPTGQTLSSTPRPRSTGGRTVSSAATTSWAWVSGTNR